MFKLSIGIEADALKAILDAGENICIVLNAGAVVTSAAQARTSVASASPQVLWQVLTAEEHNVVQWEADQWSLFVADNADPGSTLVMMDTAAAVDGRTVPFNGTFGAAGGSLSNGCYGAGNMFTSRDRLAVGLACSAVINGRALPLAPLAVCIVPSMHYAQLTPGTTVQVFLQSRTNTSLVLPNAIDSVPRHAADGNGGTLALSYDSASASFVEQAAAP